MHDESFARLRRERLVGPPFPLRRHRPHKRLHLYAGLYPLLCRSDKDFCAPYTRISTDLVCVYASIDSAPISRPNPDCL